MSKIQNETLKLKELLLDESSKAPDMSGRTQLLIRAEEISAMDILDEKKKFQEDVVCNLVKYFNEFDETNFSELESFIFVSGLSTKKISEAFADFVRVIDENEDVIFKACVARSVQHFNRTAFSLDYLLARFARLTSIEPWLMSELIITCNWTEGVKYIKTLLESPNYDASYLFALLPEWMKDEQNDKNISNALQEWLPKLKDEDKKIAEYYINNFGYEKLLPLLSKTELVPVSEIYEPLLTFKKRPTMKKFETLPC